MLICATPAAGLCGSVWSLLPQHWLSLSTVIHRLILLVVVGFQEVVRPFSTEMLSYKGMFRYLPREKFRFTTFLDPMLLHLGLREFLAYKECNFYKQVPENKILPYFMSTLSQLLKVWTHEIKRLSSCFDYKESLTLSNPYVLIWTSLRSESE